MKITFLAISALAAMLFAGCTSSDELTTLESIKTADNTPTPVQFGTYMSKTRAGSTTAMTSETLKTLGFGVFAYYTENTDYTASQSTYNPNFMYNQQITWNSDKWEYSPVKYWPNQSDLGKVSFFAYAPYVALSGTALTAGGIEMINELATSGGTAGTPGVGNQKKGNPTIKYTMSNVDLLWGTANSSDVTTGDATQLGATLTGGKGAVNVNLLKQKTNGQVKFLFKHSLVWLDKVKVMLDIDQDGEITGGSKPEATKVTIVSLTITPTANGVTNTTGTLDLATGIWTLAETPVTGTANATSISIVSPYQDVDEPANWDAVPSGITATTVNNAHEVGTLGHYLIPGTSATYTVTITYKVRTEDAKLAKGWSEVSQTMSGDVTINAGADMNKKHNLLIRLGLTSIKFAATVGEWDGTAVQTEISLPANVKAGS